MVVHGRVQGVFFRDTARHMAEARGVSGWVRNRADGSVEAVFEGDRDTVETMVSFCGEGPRGAAVEGVEVFEEEPKRLEGFRVT